MRLHSLIAVVVAILTVGCPDEDNRDLTMPDANDAWHQETPISPSDNDASLAVDGPGEVLAQDDFSGGDGPSPDDLTPDDQADADIGTPCLQLDDGNGCTTDRCDEYGVVHHEPKNCADLDPCTIDGCDPVSGECTHVPNPEIDCPPCPNCAASNPDPTCTDAICVTGPGDLSCTEHTDCPGQCGIDGHCIESWCEYEPRSCDDGDLCTADRCDAVKGCVHECSCPTCSVPTHFGQESIECDDSNACTIDICMAVTSGPCGSLNPVCQHDLLECDDRDPSTNDSCDPETGCHHDSEAP